jgi:transposase-like protein
MKLFVLIVSPSVSFLFEITISLTTEGKKELLGIWMTTNESSKFWLSVVTELHNRGVKDIFIACVDGLTGFPEAIEAVYPQTRVQLCIVHLVRNSLSYVSYKDRKAVANDLKLVYAAATESEAEQALVDFAEPWDQQYPTISKSWLNHWQRVIPFFAFPADIRKAIYTTNAIESMNMTLRKVLRNHRSFPTDESVMKVIYLAISEYFPEMDDAQRAIGKLLSIVLLLSLMAGFLYDFSSLDTNFLTNPIDDQPTHEHVFVSWLESLKLLALAQCSFKSLCQNNGR